MALVRILIDGYSLLHSWTDLAPGKPRYSAAARDELISVLRQFRDAIETPISIIFDGAGAPPGVSSPESSRELEVLFSKAGQTADDIIERATHRLLDFGEVLVVTDDNAERETVISLGASTCGCDEFQLRVAATINELRSDVERVRERERRAFNRARN